MSHVWDPDAPTGPSSYYQTRWWARVDLDPWVAAHETVQRALVPPSEVLATLDWADTRIAGRLLDLAVEVERQRAG